MIYSIVKLLSLESCLANSFFGGDGKWTIPLFDSPPFLLLSCQLRAQGDLHSDFPAKDLDFKSKTHNEERRAIGCSYLFKSE